MPLDVRIELHKELVLHAILPSCLNCLHTDRHGVRIMATIKPTDPQDVHCEKYNAKPPLQVIVVGCAGWEQGIPF